MHPHHLNSLLAEIRSAELGRTADIARHAARAADSGPRVVEIPLKLTPVERDPFLDGLADG